MAHSLPSKTGVNGTPRRVVIKLGTGVLTSGAGKLDTARIAAVCAEIAALRASGTEVIVVSSGAVGLERSPSDTGTSDSVIMIVMMAKMANPPAPNTGMRNCAPVTEPMSMMR